MAPQGQGVVGEFIQPMAVGVCMTARIFSKFFRWLAAAALLVFSGSGAAAEAPRQAEEQLYAIYRDNLGRLENNSFGLPLFLESMEHGGRVQVDVYGIVPDRFSTVANQLTVPANWCDIVALHPNIKACTYRKQAGDWQLALYLGRKHYQPPDEARQVLYQFRNPVHRQGYLDIVLSAPAGLFGTKDHRIKFEALPIDEKTTFVRVGYAYTESVGLRLAEKGYFATLGSGKVGFTVTGTDGQGQPILVGGARGAIERNVVRYYFAIQSFLDTLNAPADRRFATRINDWYELTNRYPKQLFELEREDYLVFKTREHQNQLLLQLGIETSPP